MQNLNKEIKRIQWIHAHIKTKTEVEFRYLKKRKKKKSYSGSLVTSVSLKKTKYEKDEKKVKM